MRVAVIADVHGNAPALGAVLAEIEREEVDLVVDLGDVLAGPLPAETFALLRGLGDGVRHVRGNGDRELVAAFDDPAWGEGLQAEGMVAAVRFAAARMGREARDALAAFEPPFALDVEGLGPVRFCHGTPRSDEEIVTAGTSAERLLAVLVGVEEAVVVGGHTHMQLDRRAGRHRVVNAGSVGMAYEGRPGAFWALLGPDVELRETAYDVAAAAAMVRASGYPDAEGFAAENLLAPPGPDVVAPLFERAQAERAS
jgi:predicted phosphodiesterase